MERKKNKIQNNVSNNSDIKLYMIKNKQIIFKNFEEYNIYLVNHSIKITIREYIECIHFHLFNYIDISIFDLFLKYSKDDKLYNIESYDLFKFGLINSIDNTLILEKLIIQYELKEDLDYRLRKLNKIQKEYKFTSRCLKKCLIKFNTKYIDYYLLLENCIKHYTEYQTNLYHKLGFIQDIKLDNLIKNYENQTDNINNLINVIQNLNIQNKSIAENINLAHEKINTLYYDIEKDKDKVNNKFKKILYTFSLYKLSENKLYYINTYSDIHNIILKKINLKYDYFELIYNIDYNAKYIDIISKVKNKFKDNLIFFNSEIILNNIISSKLIDFIKEEVKKYN